MGAKTGLLIFAQDEVATALRHPSLLDAGQSAALAAQVHPGYDIEQVEDGDLGDGIYPPEEVMYVGRMRGIDVICDQRFMIDYPSQLPQHLIGLAAGRRIVLHAMHSVVDWFAFAVWESGSLVRSLSLSPDGGIVENIGEPFAFEMPFWAGNHPVEAEPGWPNQEPYPLPFHPLELGEKALRALCGFVLEGYPYPDDIDPYAVILHGFRVVDPSGAERAARQVEREAARSNMGPPRIFRYGPDGRLEEVDDLRAFILRTAEAASRKSASARDIQRGTHEERKQSK